MSITTNNAATAPKTNIDGDIPDTEKQLPELAPHIDLKNIHPSFRHCTPPDKVEYIGENKSLFLAGSIEMGAAITWQRGILPYFQHLPLTVCNPRRGHWDTTTKPTKADKNFHNQVEWELNALDKATVICFFFDITTLSPVSMLELGLWAKNGNVVVCCNEEFFWKGGNIRIVCDRLGIPYVTDFSQLIATTKKMLKKHGLKEITDEEIERDRKWADQVVADNAEWKASRSDARQAAREVKIQAAKEAVKPL
ncbi:hypothetical protein EJ04DRAFT_507912 [Polyplosphaeria fusca]|uniref:Uncharacterized protein n=1 Tax=Polyplosphaeria fusca TaxID=682080 RepID=A0A9P4R958_9PLEO|nr:hypothetical protein EJ04DRAFT_507912 [Polyplosphaeria fusca]